MPHRNPVLLIFILFFFLVTTVLIDRFLLFKTTPADSQKIRNSLYYSACLLLIPFSLKAPKETFQNFFFDLITYTGCVVFASKYIGARTAALISILKLPYRKMLPILVISSVLLYMIILGMQTTAKFLSFSMEWMDFSYEFPPIWNSFRYGFFRMINEFSQETSMFRYHWQIFYIFLTPLTLFLNGPLPVLWLQTLFFAATAVTAAFLTYEYTRDRIVSYSICLIVITYLPMQLANLYDLHADPFAMPFILLSFLFAKKQSWLAYAASVIIAMSCKEYVGLVYTGFGIWLAFRSPKAGIITAVSGLLWFLFVIKVGIPFFNDGIQPIVISTNYTELGGEHGLAGMFTYFLSHPQAVVIRLFRQNNISSTVFILLPFLFIPCRSLPILAAGLFVFLKNALSMAGIELLVHRETLFISFMIYALINAVSRMRSGKRYTLMSIFTACIITSLLQGHAFPSRGFWLQKDRYVISSHDRLCHSYISDIPESSSVMISSHLSAAVMDRKYYFLFPRFHQTIKPDYILVDTVEQQQMEWLSKEEQRDSLSSILSGDEYQLVRSESGVFMFQRKLIFCRGQ